MKCSLCKYRNAVDEAIRHPNGVTVHTVLSLGGKLKENRQHVCDEHKNDGKYSGDLSIVLAKVGKANLTYTAMEDIWYEPVYTPRGERLG